MTTYPSLYASHKRIQPDLPSIFPTPTDHWNLDRSFINCQTHQYRLLCGLPHGPKAYKEAGIEARHLKQIVGTAPLENQNPSELKVSRGIVFPAQPTVVQIRYPLDKRMVLDGDSRRIASFFDREY